MSTQSSTPGPQQKRFAAYLDGLGNAAGHADRIEPLKAYCKGLLLPGERKSVEPMAARLAPGNVRRMHQSLHHLVADAPWSDEELLAEVRNSVLPALLQIVRGEQRLAMFFSISGTWAVEDPVGNLATRLNRVVFNSGSPTTWKECNP